MTAAEIHEIIDAFAKTAALCKEAGVDGVEVHAVHEGYLLDQFTLKYTNHRQISSAALSRTGIGLRRRS